MKMITISTLLECRERHFAHRIFSMKIDPIYSLNLHTELILSITMLLLYITLVFDYDNARLEVNTTNLSIRKYKHIKKRESIPFFNFLRSIK